MTTLTEELTQRLVADYGFRPSADRLIGGRCPACGQPEAFTPPNNPRVVLCNRRNKCRQKTLARALYPELFRSLRRFYPPTQDDPDATARAALVERGFAPETVEEWRKAGWWRQGRCQVEMPDRSVQTFPSIRFDMPGTRTNNHRLIDYTGGDKTRTYGRYAGRVWHPPEFAPAGDIWITEAVLDSLSLIHAGLASVSVLSASHVPESWLESLPREGVRLVIAYDNDKAGRAGAIKLADACEVRSISYVLALPPPGLDWNDLLAMGELA